MNRKQFLHKLLEKTQQNNDYVYSNLYENSESVSPPATIKRMQILHMGMGKIQFPHQKHNEQVYEKQISSNNRRILVLQKVKSISQRKNQPSIGRTLRNGTYQLELDPYLEKQLESHQAHSEKIIKLQENQLSRPSFLSDSFSAEPGKKCNTHHQSRKSEHLTDSIKKMPITNQGESKYLMKSVQIIKNSKSSSFGNQGASTAVYGKRPSFFKRMGPRDSQMKKNQAEEKAANLKKQIRKNYSKTFLPAPKISAKSYIVYEKVQSQIDPESFKVHLAFNSKIKVEVASLTKIMTCIVAIEICEKLSLDPENEIIKIGKFESNIGGTSARIQLGDVYTLEDMLYGLMLPSGNDASLAIAVWGGKKLITSSERSNPQSYSPTLKRNKREYYQRFLQEMNRKSRSLNMSKTNYSNSHGLMNTMNRSCAFDIAHLSQYAMRNKLFRKIVATKFYKTTVKMYEKQVVCREQDNKSIEGDNGSQEEEIAVMVEEEVFVGEKEVIWENTHKLLHSNSKEYIGIKTGVTTAAGPCLSSCVVTECGRVFYIVVLNCKKMLLRFKETDLLKKWIFKQQKIKRMTKGATASSKASSMVSEENQEEDLSDVDEKYKSDED